MNRVERGGVLMFRRIQLCNLRRFGSAGACIIVLLLAGFQLHTATAGPLYRPGQEQRTVTASTYQISVQKNGRIDVSLLNGEAVFSNAYPAILIEGESEWMELDIASRYTFREPVNDVLGQGQALIMAKGNCEWAIRTYSTLPFFTVEAVFINTTKKPVRVLATSPWTTGDTRKPGGLWLGETTQEAVGLVFDEQPEGFVRSDLTRGVPFRSTWHTGVYNEEAGRSLIAGFVELTPDEPAFTFDRLEDGEGNDSIELFQSMTTFEESVEVPPGERLKMPLVYFAVSESDPLVGLRRFGQALGRYNGVRVERSAVDSEESKMAIASARFFQGERGESARLHPKAPASWEEAVDALTGAARLFHLNPYFWRADIGSAHVELNALTDAQRVAWIAGLALSGSVTNDDLARDSEPINTRLSRFVPSLDRPAQPVDLFRNKRPQIWSYPLDDAGEHVVVGLFNWKSDAASVIDLDFAELGLAHDAFYTAYDSLPRRYLGTASERLRVEVPPGSVRIMSLRRHVDWPSVLTFGDYFLTKSAGDESAWDARTNTLSGTVHSEGDQPVRIGVLVPEAFGTVTSSSDNVRVEWQDNERVLMMYVSEIDGKPLNWRVAFR